MKKLTSIALAAASFIAATVCVKAQTYGAISFGSFPNGFPATATSNVNQTIDCRAIRNLTFNLSAQAISASATTMQVTFLRSLDGVNFETTAPWVFTLQVPGTSTASMCTNIDVGASGYVRLTTGVAGSIALTNTSVVVSQKPNN